MTVQSAQSVTVLFSTRVFATGVGTNATGTPAGTLYLNGTSNAATVTVTNITTGLYKAQVTMPTLAYQDEVELNINATVSGVTDNAIIWGDTNDMIVGATGNVSANAVQLAAQTITAAAGVTFPTSVASPTNITAGTITTVSGNVNGSVGSVFGAVGSVTGNIGGSMAGSVTGSVGSVVGAVGSVTGLTASNLDTTVSSRMATYTQPTGFLAATFPTTVASPTNITAGTITTATNLTNAPTAGDFTAAMKTSLNAATPASVVGAVGSVTASVAITSNVKKNQALNGFQFLMTDSTTHAPKTGVTVTATRSLDGGAFSACANAVTEISVGWYTINLATTDLNANTVALRFTGAASDDRDIQLITQP